MHSVQDDSAWNNCRVLKDRPISVPCSSS